MASQLLRLQRGITNPHSLYQEKIPTYLYVGISTWAKSDVALATAVIITSALTIWDNRRVGRQMVDTLKERFRVDTIETTTGAKIEENTGNHEKTPGR